MSHKIIIHLKTSLKPIILTEKESNPVPDEESIKELFTAKEIMTVKTGKDTVYIRPSELQAVMVTDDGDSSE